MLRTSHRATKAALTGATALALIVTGGYAAGAASATTVTLPAGVVGGDTPGLARLLDNGTPSGRAIATFDGIPTATQVTALKALGLTVQPMKRLPLALVSGSVALFRSAVTTGVANDVYPDENIQLLDTTSSDAMGGAALRAKGLTGRVSRSGWSTRVATQRIPTSRTG